jgi:pyridoxamine 5'-phosphate oxidase
MSDTRLQRFRREYLAGELSEDNMLGDPHLQFMEWLDDAIRSDISDPTAMALATSGADGRPSARVVLLKEAREQGYVFYTNYNSRKGEQLDENPNAAILFFWSELERQLRIEGVVEKIPENESNEFFDSRPLESRITSIISPQSKEINTRYDLSVKVNELLVSQQEKAIKRPAYWGGYILKPSSYEFWQGRENRLNDRILYSLNNGNWEIKRLAP